MGWGGGGGGWGGWPMMPTLDGLCCYSYLYDKEGGGLDLCQNDIKYDQKLSANAPLDLINYGCNIPYFVPNVDSSNYTTD